MNTIAELLQLAEEVPAVVALVEKIVSIVKGAPTKEEGVAQVQAHMDKIDNVTDSSVIGVAPDLKTN